MSLTVYKSSAGSGKTYTLVKEYLLLVIKEPYKYKEILAITFTNKAAAEMKNRIIQYLRALAEPTSTKVNTTVLKHLLPVLIEKTGFNEEEIKQRAEKVLGLLLHNYSDFAIGTIDSFAHKIVRTFAYDLFLPINFEVEMDTDTLLAQCIDLLINEVGNDNDLTKMLVDFTETKTDDEKGWNIESDLFKFSSALFKEESIIHLEKLKNHTIKDFFVIKNNLIKNIKTFENKIHEEAATAHQFIKTNHLTHQVFYHTDKGVGKYFENLFNKQFDKIEPNSYVQTTVEEDKWLSNKATESEKTALLNIKPQLQQAFINISTYKEQHYKKYVLNLLINEQIFNLSLLNEIKLTLEELKKQNNLVFISDFNKQIADIVLNEPVPFIYERIGDRYKNYFIDEFQDTSLLQWQNILPLIDNSLSEGGFNLIVGDGKQAIYRWRGGEVEQFVKLPNIYGIERTKLIEERENSLKRNYIEENLSNNFRSQTEIVKFNKSFFNIIQEVFPDSVKSIYNNQEQTSSKEKEGGLISIDFLPTADDVFDNYNDITNYKVLTTIQTLLTDNFQYKDIAILCRSNKNASNIARFLIKNDINVISSESLLLKSSPEVLFILACLKFINNVDDLISVYAIYNYLKCNAKIAKPEEQANISENQSILKTFYSLLKQNTIDFHRDQLTKLMIYEQCEELIQIFKLNNRKDPYLIAFLDFVFKYSTKKNNNLADFLEWWDKKCEKLSITTPEGINAVQILTIHKAKGLEFPVVIYPYAKGLVRKSKDKVWLNLEKENIANLPTTLVNISEKLKSTDFQLIYTEEMTKSKLDVINMLYVVFTRASERLYIFSEQKEKEAKEINNISSMLAYYLEKRGIYNPSVYSYLIGKATKHSLKDDNPQNTNTYVDTILSDNIKRKVLIKSIFDNTSLNEQYEENILWGNIFHSILAKVNTSTDVEKAVNDFFTNELFPEHYKNIINKKINNLLSNNLIKPYFAKDLKVENEAELVCENGKILRPDRIIFNENALVIIDYKTGKINESHKNQINEYAKALESMNYTIDKKLLINISAEMVEEVA
ncbi:MAG: hypothetical protein AUJ97_05395 [Bacteroidetes bacterium CG2_30_32_10]|nr:MAG: hypothetical protein AUJ97_05395 [Bacteroidetes bacterium CG2_30_32_10]